MNDRTGKPLKVGDEVVVHGIVTEVVEAAVKIGLPAAEVFDSESPSLEIAVAPSQVELYKAASMPELKTFKE